MKKIIDGSLYNTDTAKLIGGRSSSLPTSDFTYYSEDLYRTKSGKYFLHGEGGAMSTYGTWDGNTGGWGEQIMPFAPSKAAHWAEENLDADDYTAAFGEVPEASDDRVPITLSISELTKTWLYSERERTGETLSSIVDRICGEKRDAQ